MPSYPVIKITFVNYTVASWWRYQSLLNFNYRVLVYAYAQDLRYPKTFSLHSYFLKRAILCKNKTESFQWEGHTQATESLSAQYFRFLIFAFSLPYTLLFKIYYHTNLYLSSLFLSFSFLGDFLK